MVKESISTKQWTKFILANNSLLDKLFWANSGGAIAVLSFIGGSLASGSEARGVFVLIFFILGVCSAILSMFLSVFDELITYSSYSRFEKAIDRHYLLNPEKKFLLSDYDENEKKRESLRNILGDHKIFDHIIKNGDTIDRSINFMLSSSDYSQILHLSSLIFFIIGCTSGIVLLLML